MNTRSIADRQISLFLSYASEDFDRVSQLYEQLQSGGIQPWMDKKDIVGGEDWERSIWRAARAADFFVVCLTEKATIKRGFLQREIKRALTIWEEKLQDDIFLIPVRLEDCLVPESLNRFQRVDLFTPDGFERLLNALRIGAERRDLPFKVRSADDTSLRIVTRSFSESLRRALAYEISIDYPQIEGSAEQWQQEINRSIEGYATSLLHQHRKFGLEGIDDEKLGARLGEFTSTSTLDASYDVTLFGKGLLSIQFAISTYGAGAAHSNFHTDTLNYQLTPTLHIELIDLFKSDSDHLNVISNLCIEELNKQALESKLEDGAEDQSDEEYLSSVLWLEGAGPNDENFEAFTITPHGLVFHFHPYQVSAYVWGPRIVKVPYSAIHSIVDMLGPLAQLL